MEQNAHRPCEDAQGLQSFGRLRHVVGAEAFPKLCPQHELQIVPPQEANRHFPVLRRSVDLQGGNLLVKDAGLHAPTEAVNGGDHSLRLQSRPSQRGVEPILQPGQQLVLHGGVVLPAVC